LRILVLKYESDIPELEVSGNFHKITKISKIHSVRVFDFQGNEVARSLSLA
jgi:hypothetical protein